MSVSSSSPLTKTGLLTAAVVAMTAAAAPHGALAAGAAAAPSGIDFPTFADAGSLSLNGTATIVTAGPRREYVLRLTGGGYRQAGSAWAADQIDLTRSFDTSFRAYLHHGESGADGIALLLQSVGPRALGGWGGGIGYRGIERSVAVEFDDFRNAPDLSANHVALVVDANPDYPLADAEAPLPLFGAPFWAHVSYDAASHNLRVYLKSTAAGTSEQLVLDRTVDLSERLGTDQAWIGFTGSTGNASSKQDITAWKLEAASTR